MKSKLLDRLCCPDCKTDLRIIVNEKAGEEVISGELVCEICEKRYPVVNGIPRFVSSDNYARSFGFEWDKFAKTQLDSYSGLPISRERFFCETGWLPSSLENKVVLDAGCGAGRFAEVALSCGAEVVAMDYSSAVDVCWQNLSMYTRLNIIQANIYRMPFKAGNFDAVYCLGVLQHTPDVKKAFMSLLSPLKGKGELVIDIYPKTILSFLLPKYWLRIFTVRMKEESLLKLVRWMVKYLLPLSRTIGRIPLLGYRLKKLIPVANYEGTYPLDENQIIEWALLDTFDMLSPTYDYPQSSKEINKWFKQAGFTNFEVFRQGVYVGRGIKP